ncbi:hypothetical protein C3478_24475 [Mycobacterium kansasii]|nr:hypothetical protein C3478_24475 [Mycobacterium kansasii]
MSGNGIGITRTWRLRSACGRGASCSTYTAGTSRPAPRPVHLAHSAASCGFCSTRTSMSCRPSSSSVTCSALGHDRPRQAAAFGITIAGQRDQVPMPARHERLRPGPVHMPPAPL